MRCEFCSLFHQPCDEVFCYCGTTAPNAKGEGYNAACSAKWGDGV